MPRQNRVTPFGEIIATPERGTFMGNRGVLHDAQGHIQRPWQVHRWLVCVLEFRGRHREVMTPNRYTELFFLDEATALAAGHRPCAECRYTRFLTFCQAWKSVHPCPGRPRADDIDRRLHAERMTPDRCKRTYIAKLDELPDGVFVTLEEDAGQAYVVCGRTLLAWSPAGYVSARHRTKVRHVQVLTPRSTVSVIAAGYAPETHASALR